MTGPHDSVIGLDKKTIINNFLTQINKPADMIEEGEAQINGVYLEINTKTGKTKKIERIYQTIKI